MRTEACVIDLIKTEYGTYAAPNTNRVIRNTNSRSNLGGLSFLSKRLQQVCLRSDMIS